MAGWTGNTLGLEDDQAAFGELQRRPDGIQNPVTVSSCQDVSDAMSIYTNRGSKEWGYGSADAGKSRHVI